MDARRSFCSRAGAWLERWGRHLGSLSWTPPPDPDVVSFDASAHASLDEQLADLFGTVRHQELIWKADDWLKGPLRRGHRHGKTGRRDVLN